MLLLFGILVFVTGIASHEHDHEHHHQLWNNTFQDLLRKDLISDYDRFSRPANLQNVTDLNVTLTIYQIDVNEKKSLVTMFGRILFTWTDDKLKWSPEAYGGLDHIHLAAHEVWKPDITLYNSAMGQSLDVFGATNTIVYPVGKVLWVPPTKFLVFCDLDLTKWPFDTQKCYVKIGSWTYSAKVLNIQIESEAKIEKFMTNPVWEIVEVKSIRHETFYPCCPEPYADIQYNITAKRHSMMQKNIAFVPITFVIVTTLVSFLFPSTAGEKILVNCINAVILVLLMIYFSFMLPISTTNIPLIVQHHYCTLYLICIALVIGAVVLKVSRKKNGNVPKCFKCVIDSFYAKILGISSPRSRKTSEQELEDGKSDKNLLSSEENELYWPLVGTLVDRTAFVAYFIVFVVMMSKHF